MAKLFRAVVMGPPGSGKGTISKRIAQSFGLQYLSSGHFVHEGIAAKTEAGLLVKSYVEKGMLVPDHVMTKLVLPKLEQMSNHSWVLDGFPRTLAQAQALNNLCQLDLAISLNIPYETLRERLSDRWIHPSSGRVYNMSFNPPRVQRHCVVLKLEVFNTPAALGKYDLQGLTFKTNALQGKDDVTGEPLVQHDDDKPEALMARLRHYKEVAKPVIDLYKSQGILHSFSGTDTDKIWPYINSLFSTKLHIGELPNTSTLTQT